MKTEEKQTLMDFRKFLKRRYGGNTLRAWLSALDLDKSMGLQRVELFKAVHHVTESARAYSFYDFLIKSDGFVTTALDFWLGKFGCTES